MRHLALFVILIQAILVAAFAFGLGYGWFPLGVPGEWEWQRLHVGSGGTSWLLGLSVVLFFALFAAGGFRALSRAERPGNVGFWLSGLALLAVLVQGMSQEAAPSGYGLSKWIFALGTPGSSGYYTVAGKQMTDPARFLADFPEWIAKQDSLHVGTHLRGCSSSRKPCNRRWKPART